MNYYHRHLGDYAKNTSHLTLMEHGAYTLLMDRYYVTEKPIPVKDAYRICHAISRQERAAVDAVLKEFFERRGESWRKRRCDEEIAKAQSRIASAKANGARGGRPKVTQQEPSWFQSANPAESSPISNLQSPKNKNPEGAKSAQENKTRLFAAISNPNVCKVIRESR